MHALLRRLATLCLPLAGALPAAAGVEFSLVVTADKRPLAGGEVCFYKTAADPSGYAPEAMFFASNDVRCYPSDTILDVPAGRFFFFGRHPDGYVSPHRYLRYAPEATNDDCYRKIEVDVQRAATLDLAGFNASRAPDESIGVWVEDTKETLGTFLPAPNGAPALLVPAGIRVVPLVIAAGKVRRIGKPMSLQSAQSAAPQFDRSGAAGAMLAWVAAPKVRSGGPDLSAARPPRFALQAADGTTHAPLTEPRHAAAIAGTLLLFTGVPPGKAEVSVSGAFWGRDRIETTIVAGEVATASRGLDVVPAGAIALQLPPDLWERVQSLSAVCGADPTAFVAEVLDCAEGAAAGDGCRVVSSTRIDVARPVPLLELTSLPPATYRVRLQPEELGGAATVSVEALRTAKVMPELSGTAISGTVRRGAKPARATVTFASMDVAGTNADGRYSVRLKRDPGTLPVRVEPCDEPGAHALFFPPAAPAAGEPFDVVIPDNALRVKVTDGATGAPVEGSRVTYSPPSGDGRVEFLIAARSDASGEAAFRGIPTARKLEICASAEGYDRACAPPFTIGDAETLTRTLSLLPKRVAGRGRVQGTGAIERGQIFFCDAAGRELARAPLQPDGTFAFPPLPPQTAAAVIASATTPLLALRIAIPAAGDELRIDVPRVPARSFSVGVAEDFDRADAWVGLAIGDLTIPAAAFQHHQMMRQQQIVIVKRRPVLIADVAEVAPITLRLGPDPKDSSYPMTAVASPEYASAFPAATLARGQTSVVFRR